MKRLLYGLVGILIIVEGIFIYLSYRSFLSKPDELNINDNLSNNKNTMFAILLEQDNGIYIETSDSKWPDSTYTFNQEKSGCVDNNGVALDKSVLTFDIDTRIALVTTNTTTYCYLYFDKK